MMSFTLNDLALLLIALAIGWVLGLMMSGRGKMRRRWKDEEVAHRTMVRERDERIKSYETRLEAANARIAELERHSAPIGAATGAATGAAVAGAANGRDDLSQIRGVSQAQEAALNEAGYHRFDQIADLTAEQEATVEGRLGLKPGTIAHEDWRAQASELASGRKRGFFGRMTTPV